MNQGRREKYSTISEQSFVDATTDIPPDRWNIRKFYDANPGKSGKSRTYRRDFLKQIDQFDAQFFGISPREAASLDPQQRLLIEVAWETREDAGLVPEDLAGTNTGVVQRLFDTKTAELVVAQHANAARDEIQELIDELQALAATTHIPTPTMDHLFKAVDATIPNLAKGSSKIRLSWRGTARGFELATTVYELPVIASFKTKYYGCLTNIHIEGTRGVEPCNTKFDGTEFGITSQSIIPYMWSM